MSKDQQVIIHGKVFELFLEKKDIKKAIKEMAGKINDHYGDQSITVIGVLDGVFMVLADLLKRLKMPVSLELVKLKSYQGMQSSGSVSKLLGLTSGLKDHHVLIVEDIIDTGETLGYLLQELRKEQAASIQIASLLLKPSVFKNRFPLEYVGLEIPERFVVGYGMDYDGEGRQLPHVYALSGSESLP